MQETSRSSQTLKVLNAKRFRAATVTERTSVRNLRAIFYSFCGSGRDALPAPHPRPHQNPHLLPIGHPHPLRQHFILRRLNLIEQPRVNSDQRACSDGLLPAWTSPDQRRGLTIILSRARRLQTEAACAVALKRQRPSDPPARPRTASDPPPEDRSSACPHLLSRRAEYWSTETRCRISRPASAPPASSNPKM